MENCSPNCMRCQEATLLFLEQLKKRPDIVTANLNALLTESGFQLEVVYKPKPSDCPTFCWEPPPEMEEAYGAD